MLQTSFNGNKIALKELKQLNNSRISIQYLFNLDHSQLNLL